MARVRTFLELQDDAYLRADEVGNTDRFPRSEVGRYVNQGCAEAWGHIVEAQPKGWAENATPYSTTTTANTNSYTLPNTVMKIISVRMTNGGTSYTLEPFGEDEESVLEDNIGGFNRPAGYQIRRQTLYLAPVTSAGSTLKVRFVPHHTDLSANADTWDAVLPGSDDYPVVYAAMMMETKNQRWDSVAQFQQELARLEAKIKQHATKDITMPRRIKDTRGLRRYRMFTRFR